MALFFLWRVVAIEPFFLSDEFYSERVSFGNLAISGALK
jgi:hypothetical protein